MQKSKQRSIRVLASLAVTTSLAGLIIYYGTPGEELEPTLTGEAVAIRSALARIEAESRGTLQAPRIQAAPRTAETRLTVKRSAADPVPSPPDGYSFVSYHGEMPRTRIAGEFETGDLPLRVPVWTGWALHTSI